MSAYAEISTSGWTTADLTAFALSAHDRTAHGREVWELLSSTRGDAAAFLADLNEDDRRDEVVNVLADAGWTLHLINVARS